MNGMATSGATIWGLIEMRAAAEPDAIALDDGTSQLSYADLIEQSAQIASGLTSKGIVRGDRVAILSENSIRYTLLQMACARIGAIAACQNWRLSVDELQHCISLVEPALFFFSERYREVVGAIGADLAAIAMSDLPVGKPMPATAQADDPWLIIYTSGTTGLPKAAVISQRAEIARMCTLRLDLGLEKADAFIAWAPMFHMGGTEHTMATLMAGGRVFVIDGYDPAQMATVLQSHAIGWLLLVPSTIMPLVEELRRKGVSPLSVKAVGCMADLCPEAEIAAAIETLGAPFLNSFGATETGLGPLTGNLVRSRPDIADLAKQPSSLYEIRLTDSTGLPCADGEVGEAVVRSPCLFDGYWNAPDANADAFRDGWFRMGDLFSKRPDGRFEYAGRSKYLIKSGGENIYPAEIERVLLGDPRVEQAVVVRQSDAQWGEVPVAIMVASGMSEDDARALLELRLARYKLPRRYIFVTEEALRLNVSGKANRTALEQRLEELAGL